MKLKLCEYILRVFGWRIKGFTPVEKKYIIVSAPHTSYWDFIIGRIAGCALGIKPHFFIKKEFFVFPFGLLLKSLGGIPVDRSHAHKLIKDVVSLFQEKDSFVLVITPEGTRQRVSRWKAGFYYIAEHADVPIVLTAVDYKYKTITISKTFNVYKDLETTMDLVKQFFKDVNPKFPEQFTI